MSTYLSLERTVETDKSTKGKLQLIHNNLCVFECDTLELPWRDNKKRISRIPDGKWKVKIRKVGGYYNRYRKRFGHSFVLEIIVNGRTAILIHIGNYPKNTLGCILVGIDTGVDNFIGRSTDTYEAFIEIVSETMPTEIVIL